MKHSIPRSPFATRLSGSARETELRIRNLFQGPKKRPPVPIMILAALLILSCGWLVSCQPREGTSGSPAPGSRADQCSADGLNLDGSGGTDDSLILTTSSPSDSSDGLIQVRVRLGTGEELTWEQVSAGYYCSPKVHGAYLTSSERQTAVLELFPWGSNWTPSLYILLEWTDGVLTEAGRLTCDFADSASLAPRPALMGLEVVDRTDSSLQALRVPTHVDKWHAPEWGTLTWEDGQWNYQSDGYFTDTWPITVDDGRELTLALRGRLENSDVFSFDYLIYDRIQVLEGETVLQTITPEGYLPQQYYEPSGFLADYVADHGADVRDINFDGVDDFGLLCDTTKCDTHAWFVWNGDSRQFRYLAHLGGDLTADADTQQLTEVLWDQSFDHQLRNLYRYDSQGNLVLTDTRPVEQSAG